MYTNLGSFTPIRFCDRECMLANHCRIGGVQCEKCGRYYCSGELNDNWLCDLCAPKDEDEDEEADGDNTER